MLVSNVHVGNRPKEETVETRVSTTIEKSSREIETKAMMLDELFTELLTAMDFGFVIQNASPTRLELNTLHPTPENQWERETIVYEGADDDFMKVAAFCTVYNHLANAARLQSATKSSPMLGIFDREGVEPRNFNLYSFPAEMYASIGTELNKMLDAISDINRDPGKPGTPEYSEMRNRLQGMMIRASMRIVFGSKSELLKLVTR